MVETINIHIESINEEKITLMKNTVAIIQARMGSKKLPGKMLKKLSKFLNPTLIKKNKK